MLNFLLQILSRIKTLPSRVETDDTRETKFLRTGWVYGLQNLVRSTAVCAITVQISDLSNDSVCETPRIINFIPVLLGHCHRYRSGAEVASVHLGDPGAKMTALKMLRMG